jgi:heme oxygenase
VLAAGPARREAISASRPRRLRRHSYAANIGDLDGNQLEFVHNARNPHY